MPNFNTGLIVMMIVTIVLLLASMVLSSMASSSAGECKCPDAHNYSMYAALVTGISALLIGGFLGLYIYREEIAISSGLNLASNGGMDSGLGSGVGKFKFE